MGNTYLPDQALPPNTTRGRHGANVFNTRRALNVHFIGDDIPTSMYAPIADRFQRGSAFHQLFTIQKHPQVNHSSLMLLITSFRHIIIIDHKKEKIIFTCENFQAFKQMIRDAIHSKNLREDIRQPFLTDEGKKLLSKAEEHLIFQMPGRASFVRKGLVFR